MREFRSRGSVRGAAGNGRPYRERDCVLARRYLCDAGSEVYTAVLPSLATTNGMLVGISSPYRKTGLLHAKHKESFGVDGDDVLVVQGSSRTFNPSLTEATIAAQKLADPTAAASEWDAEFRADLVGFLDDAIIDRAINRDRPLELPPDPLKHYEAFVDPSGGAIGGDSYTITIVHKEKDGRLIVDVVRGHQGPFSVDDVTFEYAALCKEYRIHRVRGDFYAAQWVAQAWQKTGIRYEKAELNASMLYLEALPLWTRGLVEIPDHAALVRELRLLERIPGRIGKDQVTHPRNVHDDLANSVCGALALASLAAPSMKIPPELLAQSSRCRQIRNTRSIGPPVTIPTCRTDVRGSGSNNSAKGARSSLLAEFYLDKNPTHEENEQSGYAVFVS